MTYQVFIDTNFSIGDWSRNGTMCRKLTVEEKLIISLYISTGMIESYSLSLVVPVGKLTRLKSSQFWKRKICSKFAVSVVSDIGTHASIIHACLTVRFPCHKFINCWALCSNFFVWRIASF